MLYPVEDFVACLAPTEYNVLYGVLQHWYSLEFYITHDDFDLLWLLETGDMSSPRKDAFITEYHLIDSEVHPDEETTILVWAMYIPFWVLLANYNDFHGWTPTKTCYCQLSPP